MEKKKKRCKSLIPLGFWEADMIQESSSEAESRRSRQSRMAWPIREFPNLLSNFDTKAPAFLTKSTAVFAAPENSNGGTLKHSIWTYPVEEKTSFWVEHRERVSKRKKVDETSPPNFIISGEIAKMKQIVFSRSKIYFKDWGIEVSDVWFYLWKK